MNKALRLFSLFSLVMMLFTPAIYAADAVDHGVPAGTIIVPAGLKSEEVQRCILEAGAGRGWTIRQKDDEKVVLFLEQGKWVSNMTLTYDTKEIQIYSKSTRGGKPKVPEDWVKFLKKDINVKLNTLAISR
jgi:hypothetical protein